MAGSARLIGFQAAPDLRAALDDWRAWLAHERRASAHTCEAYARDLSSFLAFLSEHLGGPPSLAALEKLRPADFRAWLAARARQGLQRSSTARALSVVRNLFRWLQVRGLAENPSLAAVSNPRLPRPVPKALAPEEAVEAVEAVAELSERPWNGKRDSAILLLLYGAGLRIGEALALRRRDAPAPDQETLLITGKGGKQRLVPLLPAVVDAVQDYLAVCPYTVAPDGPLFLGQSQQAAQLGHALLHLARSQRAAALAEEQGPVRRHCIGASGQVVLNRVDHGRQQRYEALLAALAGDQQRLLTRGGCVPAPQAERLSDPQPRAVEQ